MSEKNVYVGIDVSAKELLVAFIKDGKTSKAEAFSNDETGFGKILKIVESKGYTRKVCLEATGIYSLDAALFFKKKGADVMVINPKAARDFARAMMSRTKTDEVDAVLLAEYASRMPFEKWQSPSKEAMTLKAISRRMEDSKKILGMEKNRLHAVTCSKTTPEIIVEDLKNAVSQAENRLKELKKAALKIMKSSKELNRKYELLISIDGIADITAITVLGELCVYCNEPNPKQIVALAGLDPKQEKSGTSINKKSCISKRGNATLRKSLYMSAIVAMTRNSYVRAFYDKLISNGKKPKQALVAIMRKLLHCIHGMFKTNSEFDGNKFYKLPVFDLRNSL